MPDYTTPHSLPRPLSSDTIRGDVSDNLRLDIVSLANASNSALSIEGARAEAAAKAAAALDASAKDAVIDAKAISAVSAANSAVITSSGASSDADNAVDRVTALESAAGFGPSTPTDGTMADIAANPETLFAKHQIATYVTGPLTAAAVGMKSTLPDVYATLSALLSSAAAGRSAYIPKGEYTLAQRDPTASLPGGARFSLATDPGTVLKVKDATAVGDYHSALIVQAAGTGDVERVDIENLSIDHNRRGQTLPAGAYDWEHSASIRLSGATGSRIKHVSLRNLDFRDPIADCIWSNTYYLDTVNIQGMRVRDRSGTRSDIQFSGMPRITQIADFVGQRIEFEAVPIPADVTHNFLFMISQAHVQQRLDLGGRANRTKVKIDNLTSATDTIFSRIGGTISNSEMHFKEAGSSARRINWPEGLTFNNCDFYIYADAAGVVAPLTVYVSETFPTRGMFKDCRFHLVPTAGYVGAFTGHAILLQNSASGNADQYEFDGCWWDERFQYSFKIDRTKHVHLINNDYGGTTAAIEWVGTGSTLTIDGGKFDRAAKFMALAPTGGTLVVPRLAMNEAQAAYTVSSGSGGLATMVTLSDRLIYVTSAPPATGFRGDRARLISPVAGAACEWVCTASSNAAATWKVSKTLAA